MTDCIPVVHQLRTEFKGSLLAYSVEVDETKGGIVENSSHSQMVEEMIHGIDAAADYEDTLSTPAERSTWVAIKLVRHQLHLILSSSQTTQTALLPDSQALVRLSQHLVRSRPPCSIPFPGSPTPRDLDVLTTSEGSPILSPTDRIALRNLRTDLFRICQRAKERQVKVVVDAEHRFVGPKEPHHSD